MSNIADYWHTFQASLFPRLESVLEEPLTPKLREFVQVLEIVRVERYVASPHAHWMGRKPSDRRSMARAFLAKAVYDCPTTELLIEMLKLQPTLRKLCGFPTLRSLPSSATFSRAFAQLAEAGFGDLAHVGMVSEHVGDKVVMHLSRDSTEVDAREKATAKAKAEPKPKRKPGRPKKGEEPPKPEPTRIQRQVTQTAEEALAELPYVCDVGTKKNSQGRSHSWVGWKAHIDWADGAIPVNVLTTSASLHDSQVAIPMARLTAQRVTSLYDLMDAAYDAEPIHQASRDLGHVPIIDANKRRGDTRPPPDPDRLRRYNERTTAERGNSRLKDEFGFRHLRVRGHKKAHLHLMFGILTLFADQLVKVFCG